VHPCRREATIGLARRPARVEQLRARPEFFTPPAVLLEKGQVGFFEEDRVLRAVTPG
jgi:hypothetical protein